MKAEQPQTNTEKVTELMDFSNQGGLMQLFVMTALNHYAQKVADLTPEQLLEIFPPTGFVHGPSWQACAQEVITALTSK